MEEIGKDRERERGIGVERDVKLKDEGGREGKGKRYRSGKGYETERWKR